MSLRYAHITLKPTLALLLLTAGLWLTACTDDDLAAADGADGSTAAGGVYVTCSIDDFDTTTYTRASSTESGWSAWGEDALSRLDVFIFERGDSYGSYTVTTTTTTKTYYSKSTDSKTNTSTTVWTITITVTVQNYDADGNADGSATTTTTSYYEQTDYTEGDDSTGGPNNTSETTTETVYNYPYTLKYHSAVTSSVSVGDKWQLVDSSDEPLREDAVAETDSIYLVANHDFDSDENTIYTDDSNNSYTFAKLISGATDSDDSTPALTLEMLKNAASTFDLTENVDTSNDQTSSTSGGPRARFSSFVMDGRLAGADAEVYRDASDYGAETEVLNVSLKRGLAKVCLRLLYKGIDDDSYSEVTSSLSTYGLSFKLMNYAHTAALINGGAYFPSYTADSSDNTYYGTSIADETAYSSTFNTYTDSYTSDTYSDDGSRTWAVLYICPNNWLDTSQVSSMNTTEPIIEDMQTHLLMHITQTHSGVGTQTYSYKVPINKLLPDDNDAAVPDESYKELYRVDRNHVYYVTVYVQEIDDGFRVTTSDDDDDDGGDIEDLSEDGSYTFEYDYSSSE